MGQKQLEDLMMVSFLGHVYRPTAPAVCQLLIGTIQKEKPGSIVAAVESREEQRRLTLKTEASGILTATEAALKYV